MCLCIVIAYTHTCIYDTFNLISQPPQEEGVGERKGDEEEDEEIPTTPEPKEWECLGSDKEILEGIVTQSRPLV